MEEPSTDRRRQPRVASAMRVWVWVLSLRGLRSAHLHDLSAASCGLRMRRPPARGSALLILLRGPGRLPLPLVARVVRSDPDVGAVFTRIPRRTRPLLHALLHGRPTTALATDAPSPTASRTERRHLRRRYDARLAALSSQLPHLLTARDLSAEGLRVDPLRWAQVGTRVEVSFPIPGHKTPVGLPATVWRHDGRHGTVLRFAELEPTQREALAALLELLPVLPDDRRDAILLTELA